MDSSGPYRVRGGLGSRPNSPVSVDGGQVHAWIDLGSTHSYICTTIPSLSSLPKNKTKYDILVTNPLGHSVIMNRVYRYCPIKIREYEFPGDLIELSFREFDVIVRPRKNPDFLRKDKIVISVKIQNFSRSQMTKRTSLLESSLEI